ncbi:putative RAMP superfamily protein probably involved in DNA repair [Candidatus Methanoperedens nitroreducens]|uniref:Putative RAMP superfamily protein probably involved in DNA repair n=1 Tax=Candidatus Methanoperedens nitratireducens TaxID=1392998 RepID=A0A062V7W5_9EURY|nr:RAMP superfamily CRISPR-associated protein [Candidatus Methanoperedens nitroreducens]KCZ73382.1 putative RAMP superfamily protein probably involved in DNA repair [Candidatus Methanoperedens nitroreducens]MDJ1422667.1 RAMP superfamily CRISPR-associated protein [Candidatus Methanoperedens sp.]
MPDFDVFENRWTISAALELETPLRIGGGQNAAAYSISAAPVLQTYNAQMQAYEPYIPGSSLKGVLRSTVERIIRTFNDNKSCISVSDTGAREKTPCRECISCGIFGSMKAGAKIRVRDLHLSKSSMGLYGSVKEQPHCATKYKIYDGKFNVQTRTRSLRNKRIEVADTFLRTEETVTSGICFDIQIDIDNADEKEIGLVLLALDEFNNKRINLGGGTSRGNGFADIRDIAVMKKSIDERFKISESPYDAGVLMREGKKYLKTIDSGKDPDRRDFDIYYKAHSAEKIPEGHIVALLKVTALSDFIMPGVEEETVTSGGLPVIPGSTIKGYLRHSLIDKGADANKIKEIFGFTERDSHRSRLLVSDAYSDILDDPNKIPSGSVLKMWMVFDNMTREEVHLIEDIIKKNSLVVTGKTSAKWDAAARSAKNNIVKMEFESVDIFKTSSYLAGI